MASAYPRQMFANTSFGVMRCSLAISTRACAPSPPSEMPIVHPTSACPANQSRRDMPSRTGMYSGVPLGLFSGNAGPPSSILDMLLLRLCAGLGSANLIEDLNDHSLSEWRCERVKRVLFGLLASA